MCPECGRMMWQGHAHGCRNGPQRPPEVIPFGQITATIPVRSCPECGGEIVQESRGMPSIPNSGLMQCAQGHHWNSHGRIIAGPTFAAREREAQEAQQRRDDGGTRVSRNRYERVQRFPQMDGSVIENPQASTDGVTWLNESWEAMRQFRRGMTESEIAIRENREPSEPRQVTRIADISIEELDGGRLVMIRTGLPSAQWSRVNNPDSWNPQDAAPVNMAKHVVTSNPANVSNPAHVRVRCTCGWILTETYLLGIDARELRGTIDAHIAGAAVGPTIARLRGDVCCFNCDFKPAKKRSDVSWMIDRSAGCCDGELLMKPRRRLVIEDIGD